jgi:uracil-DNA glycosylase
MTQLSVLAASVAACRACPRLVAWREQVAREKRRAFLEWDYWGRAVPGFGDPDARLLILGLAPAAHGANRTGRVFTGDRSGDWLYAALHSTGFASQPTSTHLRDGLELRDAYVTAAVKCAPPANRPSTDERDRCHRFAAAELEALPRVRTIVCLGRFAWDAGLRLLALRGIAVPKPRPLFGHGAETSIGPYRVIGCYHPSQQNTFTGVLTMEMLEGVFRQARAAMDQASAAGGW